MSNRHEVPTGDAGGDSPRVVLCTLNARYIHASLGLRCLMANLDRHGGTGLRAQTLLREYTVSRPTQEVLSELLRLLGDKPAGTTWPLQVVGFGVYIWNVLATTHLVRLLKLARPNVRVVLGGPEVSHEVDIQEIVALADHVITGWGEVRFAQLCRALLHDQKLQPKFIVGVQPDLTQLQLPYDQYTNADLAHRLLYVEASRGCPFQCSFCLSSLDKTAWAFDLTLVLAALEELYRRGARHFKLRVDSALSILQFFLDKQTHGPTDDRFSLHFEVVPDRLDQRLRERLAQFNPGTLQLEIGVQSFNPQVQHIISRRQDDVATEFNLRWLITHSQAHLHVDLVFGLPGESLQSFASGFDRLLAIGPQEIQLGILKRLRGAPIARQSLAHGMVYATQPPYQVIQTALIDAAQVQRFVRFARYWDLLANSGRFVRTLSLLLAPVEASGAGQFYSTASSPFWRFMALSDWLWQQLGSTQHLTPERLVDSLFEYLCQMFPAHTVRQTLLADYVASGARASPQVLRGWLPRPISGTGRHMASLSMRQHRHSR